MTSKFIKQRIESNKELNSLELKEKRKELDELEVKLHQLKLKVSIAEKNIANKKEEYRKQAVLVFQKEHNVVLIPTAPKMSLKQVFESRKRKTSTQVAAERNEFLLAIKNMCNGEGVKARPLANKFPSISPTNRYKYITQLKAAGRIRQEGSKSAARYFYVK